MTIKQSRNTQHGLPWDRGIVPWRLQQGAANPMNYGMAQRKTGTSQCCILLLHAYKQQLLVDGFFPQSTQFVFAALCWMLFWTRCHQTSLCWYTAKRRQEHKGSHSGTNTTLVIETVPRGRHRTALAAPGEGGWCWGGREEEKPASYKHYTI